jgi:RHS repeat-associated protein
MLFGTHMRSPREQPTVSGSAGPVWTNVAVTASGQSAVSGHAAVAPALQAFSYDLDGNLTQDGLWSYTWDGENRLVAVESVWGVAEEGRRRLEFRYDAQGRRVEKVVYAWDPQQWNYIAQSTNRFVYEGWNLVAVLDQNNTPLLSFVWGTDLSGTTQGAGGVGGLLSVTAHSGPDAGTYFYRYDGNGNVMALVSAGDGSVAARYEYGPFGELLRATGPMAKANPFRFSTKYQDDETGLLYYGYRYYDPNTGRWLNRDPLASQPLEVTFRLRNGTLKTQEIPGELIVGPNLYQFVGNNSIQFVDPYGLDYGDWWDPRTWFNSGFTESWSDQAGSIWNTWGDMFSGNWGNIGNNYDDSTLGQAEAAGPGVHTATKVCLGTATAATAAATTVIGLEAAGVIETTPQANNVIRVISKPLQRGIRLDKPHHGKWYHWHYWKW